MRGLTKRGCGLFLLGLVATLLVAPRAGAAARVDPLLSQQVHAAPLGLTPVVITYQRVPAASEIDFLKARGVTGGVRLDPLPMLLTRINKLQFDALRDASGVASLYANRRFPLLTNKSRPFIGLPALRADAEVKARLGGLPVSGKDIGVAYVDTGIDATHPDLTLGRTVAQNVFFPLAEYSATEMPLPADFIPIVAVENAPVSDVEGGHGTFGAGVTAGSGDASGGFYGGMAPGAKLVGLVAGNDAGLTTFAILQAYGYALANQFRYNIRVCNNSWGDVVANYPYDPLDPINTATRELHDRNIVVVFAAGNGIDSVGDAPGAINPFSVAPWVISVGAGEKQGLGTPASFSSRGEDDGTGTDTAGQPADSLAPPNLRPDLIGSGIDIKSARSKAPGVTNVAGALPIFVGSNDLTTIPPAFLPFYTTSQGTSFSTPQVSGVVALMLEANPSLTPDEVVTLLRETATPMPYPERVVGAGYVDARNAVRQAMALAAVEHPANLVPRGELPEILDAADDQLGTTAQDIRSADFAYDPVTNQIVYTLSLADLSGRTAGNWWTISSDFGATTVFVTAAVDETGAESFSYGRITPLPTGGRNQEDLGLADSGAFSGNDIVIRLSLDNVNAAVGFDVLYTTSTATEALGQILIGTSFTGGLLFPSDLSSGSDFKVGEKPPAGVNTTPSAGLVTTEAGGAAQFAVALNSRPAADVALLLRSTDLSEGSVSPASLTFTAADWDAPQVVTVTGRNDFQADGDVAYSVMLEPASADPEYAALPSVEVRVANADDDAPGITVSPTAGLVTSEKKTRAHFSVALRTEPFADVSVAIHSSDVSEGTVAPSAVSFSAANWSTPQTVTVTGVNDSEADGSVGYVVVTAPANSADPAYAGWDAADVALTNLDNDKVGIRVKPRANLVTSESGRQAELTLVLASRPTADVSVGLSSSDTTEGSVAPASVKFTSSDWNVERTVTIQGVDDVDEDGDVHYKLVTAPATSADPAYAGFNALDANLCNVDDETDEDPACGRFTERFASVLQPGQAHVDVPFLLRRSALEAKLTWSDSDAELRLDLVDEDGALVLAGNGHDKLRASNLPGGSYMYRISGQVTRPVDFVVKSTQGR